MISGLQVVPDFITPTESQLLMDFIDAQEWTGRGIPPNPGMLLYPPLF
jgi:hypothetical protein